MVVYHLILSTNTPQHRVTALYQEFPDELERDENRLYPQEKAMSHAEFEGHFFAHDDVFVDVGNKFWREKIPWWVMRASRLWASTGRMREGRMSGRTPSLNSIFVFSSDYLQISFI
jgi:hypothetical protein